MDSRQIQVTNGTYVNTLRWFPRPPDVTSLVLPEYRPSRRSHPLGQDEPAADQPDRRRHRGDHRRHQRGQYLHLSEGLGEAAAHHEERTPGRSRSSPHRAANGIGEIKVTAGACLRWDALKVFGQIATYSVVITDWTLMVHLGVTTSL